MVPSVATEKSPVTTPGIDPETVRLVAQCLNHYATPGPPLNLVISEYSSLPRQNTNHAPSETINMMKQLNYGVETILKQHKAWF